MNLNKVFVALGLCLGLLLCTCLDVEDMLLFADETSSAHVDEYHLEDSLASIPTDQWALYESLGPIATDAVYIQGNTTAVGRLGGKFIVVYFNARDVCLLDGVGVGKLYRSLGFDFFSIDFRGYGRSYERMEPTEESVCADGNAAMRFVIDSLGYRSEQVLITGFSLGTGVAVEMATRFPSAALVLYAAYTNMDNAAETIAGGYDVPGYWVLDAELDNLAKIPTVGTPVCLFSGLDDTFVTPDHTRALFRDAAEPKQMLLIEGQDHNRFVRESFEAWADVLVSFVNSYCVHAW